LFYLTEKGRLPDSASVELKAALEDPDHVFKEVPFTVEVVESLRQIARADVPDMPDRVVAATAAYFAVPVLSRDRRIHASNLQTSGEPGSQILLGSGRAILLWNLNGGARPSDIRRDLLLKEFY
jgi:hypothetical protein